MARPIWKGSISFGLVNIPVTLYSGEERKDLNFKLLDSRDKARVRYERVNEETGEEVPWDEVVKAYEYNDGDYVLVDEEEMENISVEATQTVDIENFVNRDEINPVYFEKPYYLVPSKKGQKGYVLLRQALYSAAKVGIAKVVIRTRQYLAALMPQDDALILNLLRFQHELRSIEDFDIPHGDLDEYKVKKKEIEMAESLVNNLTTEWNPEQYHDDYRQALKKYLEEKAEKGEEKVKPSQAKKSTEKGRVIDMMDLLKESVEGTSKGKNKSGKKRSRKKKNTG
jgi:DNA end-binding protein Ku